MNPLIRNASIGVTAGAVGAALAFPWSPPKPQPTFPAAIPIAVYTEQLPDGRIAGCWYSYARGRFDLATGETIPMTADEAAWDAHMAGMYGDSQTPRYSVAVKVPLPDAAKLQPISLTVGGVDYRWDGRKWVPK